MGTDPEAGLSMQFDQAVGGYLKLHKVGYDTAVYRLSKSIPTFKRLASSLFRTGQVNKYNVAEIKGWQNRVREPSGPLFKV
jgi:hypothetical protein